MAGKKSVAGRGTVPRRSAVEKAPAGRGKGAPRTGRSSQLEQDPHQVTGKRRSLESAIGREVRNFRHQLNMTVAQLSQTSGMSAGMLSKIENGQTSPSLATLQELSRALQVPVTAFFRSFEEERSATFVLAGQGLPIERRGTRAGHQYQLLGHGFSRGLAVEPYLVTLTENSDVFPIFQHDGVEFLFMLEGEVGYRHGDKLYHMRPGDSLYFDSDVPHGPEQLLKLPARFLSIITYTRDNE
ncbi:XRE family transcriptional regulator [Dongia mobilis]|uniref:XRE family transcriptional regulator n=1 Tax=Dongia mobilis TaxID=578943 RepID=A0A4R6WW88_9PROT|nr:XRE family transcriptional regulator [Dongia mobilis]TDQ83302.1 XRE family transcriptional regulator [Dongia mobilis]